MDHEFPPSVLHHFVQHGVAKPHKLDPNVQGELASGSGRAMPSGYGYGKDDGTACDRYAFYATQPYSYRCV